MRVGVVGVNHKQASLRLRELLAKKCHKWFGANRSGYSVEKYILLSTCNRTEIYFTSRNLADTHTHILQIIRQEVDEAFEQRMYSFFGEDCFYHLSAVTAGLDSAIIWETEIQGQVKAIYEATSALTVLPNELHYLFQKCLKNGKLLRSRFQMGRGIPDVEHAILDMGKRCFSDIEKTRILFVGASAINIKIMTHLKNKGLQSITLCNRTESRAQYHSQKLSIDTLPWGDFASWQEHDWIIFGTKSPKHLLTYGDLSQNGSPKLIIDLSVPRNVAPTVDRHPNVTLHNIDQVHQMLEGRRKRMEHLATEAQSLLTEVVHRQVNTFKRKTKVIPIVA
ncbi:MAG: Glutamyl-tRNA reductase [Chlamydiae bacterium]|nr:Glutamyl-tRNA reductase [Chlamydiota bacterium]